MSTTDYNTREGIAQLWRDYTGLSETTDILAADVITRINDFYVNIFAPDVDTDDFHQDHNIATAPTDAGSYDLPSNVVDVQEPVWIDGEKIRLYRDLGAFYERFPDVEEGYTTPPTLAIGTDTTKVLHAAFAYRIQDRTYEAASAETALSGDTIPSGKYGAYLLSIDTDGTVTVTDGANNATGHDTISAAIDDLPAAGSDEVTMGYVVVLTTGATFIPGTTALDAGTVTDTYTDGDPQFRSEPRAVLVVGRDLIVRPKANDIYRLKLPMVFYKPADMSADATTVFNELWGHAIALGDAIAYLIRLGAEEKAQRLNGTTEPLMPGTFNYYMSKITKTKVKQEGARVIRREF